MGPEEEGAPQWPLSPLFFPALPSEHEAWSVNFRKLFRVEQDNFCPEGKNLLTNVTNRAFPKLLRNRS